jgi:hypothetical protein
MLINKLPHELNGFVFARSSALHTIAQAVVLRPAQHAVRMSKTTMLIDDK